MDSAEQTDRRAADRDGNVSPIDNAVAADRAHERPASLPQSTQSPHLRFLLTWEDLLSADFVSVPPLKLVFDSKRSVPSDLYFTGFLLFAKGDTTGFRFDWVDGDLGVRP